MSKFILENKEAKKLIEDVSAFSTKKNALQFVIGYKDIEADKLYCMVSLSNGSSMVTKGFFAKKPADFSATTVPYIQMNVKAESFISYLGALLSFDEDILFSVEGAELRLSVGTQASMVLSLVDEVEPRLPIEYAKSVLALQLKTNQFLAFARKGCFLSEPADAQGIADRIVFNVTRTTDTMYTFEGFSTDKQAFSTAKLELAANCIGFQPMLLVNKLLELSSKLEGTEKEVLDKELAEAVDELQTSKMVKSDKLNALAAKYDSIQRNKFSFSVLADSFTLIKSILKGTEAFRMAITDTYLILVTNSVTSVFTLAASVPNYISNLDKWTAGAPLAEVVVDADMLKKGLSLLSVTEGSLSKNTPLHMVADADELRITLANNTVVAKYVDKAGAVGATNIYLNTGKLKGILDSLDNGNVYMAFRGEKLPLEVKNAAIDGQSNSFAILAPVAPPKAPDTATDDSADVDTETADE